MDVLNGRSDEKTFEALANESGLAIAIVDGSGRQVYLANNNSICRELNPGEEFSPACADFCGAALAEVAETGTISRFECHAGLECRAVDTKNPNTPLVAIIGRAFTKAENYRRATDRALSGDWKGHSPDALFENVLLTGSSSTLDKIAKEVERMIELARIEKKSRRPAPPTGSRGRMTELRPVADAAPTSKPTPQDISNLVAKFNREIKLDAENLPRSRPISVKMPAEIAPEPSQVAQRQEPEAKERSSEQVRAWRSFFGSLLDSDYPKAREAILGFVAAQYGLESLIWLDRKGDKLENSAAFGQMKNRRVRLGISAADHRLTEAAANDTSLQLGERAGKAKGGRTMNLFPIGVGSSISAAVAVLDPIDDSVRKELVRIFTALAPQLEILRLRFEILHRESLSGAVRKFSKSLRRIDADDFWLSLLQSSAEIMRAERASLLVFDDKSEKLEVKAVVGVKNWTKNNGEIGGRVAKLVLEKNKAVSVDDVATTGLPPADPERGYRTTSFLCCPISIGDRAIGVMNFTDKVTGEPFGRSSLELFQAIGPQMAVAIDRASLKNKAGEFEQLSVTDPLTGLLNRRYIEARLAEEIKRSNRHGFPMSFMMIDVDHFKQYNDQFGHPAGDEALKLVGHIIRDTLRGADVAARFGGEEFAILLPQTTSEEAIAIGERIRHNIEHAAFRHRLVTTSIGVASCSAELCVSADLVSAADKALYEAKRRGRNRVIAFEEMNGAHTERTR